MTEPRPILTHEEHAVMLANALRALLTTPSEKSRYWAKAALERYQYDTDRRTARDSEDA